MMKCKIFKDNKSCIQLAKAPRMNPRTKYIALKYHHFRSYVSSGLVEIEQVTTEEQISDIFTKAIKFICADFLDKLKYCTQRNDE